MYHLDVDDRDECRAHKRTNHQTLSQTYVVVGRTEVDEVARADSDDSSAGYPGHETFRGVVDGSEAHTGDSGGYSVGDEAVVRNHTQILDKVVLTADFNSQRNTEAHRHDHEHSVGGSDKAVLDMVVEHVVDKVDQWHSRHDIQRAGHKGMVRRVGVKHCSEPLR